jgi:hypothetical protein
LYPFIYVFKKDGGRERETGKNMGGREREREREREGIEKR